MITQQTGCNSEVAWLQCVLQVGCQSALPVTLRKNNALRCAVEHFHWHFPVVWCVVYIHFAACSLTTNLQMITIQVRKGSSLSWEVIMACIRQVFTGEGVKISVVVAGDCRMFSNTPLSSYLPYIQQSLLTHKRSEIMSFFFVPKQQ